MSTKRSKFKLLASVASNRLDDRNQLESDLEPFNLINLIDLLVFDFPSKFWFSPLFLALLSSSTMNPDEALVAADFDSTPSKLDD